MVEHAGFNSAIAQLNNSGSATQATNWNAQHSPHSRADASRGGYQDKKEGNQEVEPLHHILAGQLE